MKLELKHLAGYLPYGLKYYTKSRINDKNGFAKLNASCINHVLNNQFKPILRPLLDLDIHKMRSNNNYPALEVFQSDVDFLFKLNQCWDAQTFDYTIFEYLLKEHFDIFGLIKQGLAIDINTLIETPNK